MAFIFLNRYIDFADAIDDGSGDILDNKYFADTDIPTDVNLPEAKHLSVSLVFKYPVNWLVVSYYGLLNSCSFDN
jgi:hypothetical protein